MATNDKRAGYRLQVPLDASSVQDFKPERAVKVVAFDSQGRTYEDLVKLDEKGRGTASLAIDELRGNLRVLVGPEGASAEQLKNLQTITMNVSKRQWGGKAELVLSPVEISHYYWWWWIRWCRRFKISGVVRCANGNPVGQSAKVGCKMIHISTDYVYDGNGPRPYREDNPVDPQSAYGKTKLEGEILCQKYNPESIIIRTSWLYSAFGNNFVKTMVRLGNERSELGVIADQIGSPTNAADLARAILTIISSAAKDEKRFIPGIYHYSNEGVASWYDFTKAIFEIAKINCLVKPIATEDYPSPAQRPPYSVMNKSKIKLIFGLQIPHWRDSLTEYFQKNK